MQKCEEVKRIANLAKLWNIALRVREKSLLLVEAFRLLYVQVSEIQKYDAWSFTSTEHFKALAPLHMMRNFFACLGFALSESVDLGIKYLTLTFLKNYL